ncbi:MAG: adenylate/guanylate cyclase domain-containing protein [Gammaproteobacteria bacterium]|nr:adenylate/guanylate cyclase domain-containing protein [Gammaproteobacteria bacterium]
MPRKTADLAIVFADISGSTRLYDSLGDANARELVADCLDILAEQTGRHQGTVIKTIGDEIMCTFPSADQALEAAVDMQDCVARELPERNPNTPSSLQIRIGLHFGNCLVEEGDVFGDAVNVAARMAGLAKGGQIITTGDTAEMLSQRLRSVTRHVDRLAIRGKTTEIDIFEAIWQADDVTRIHTDLLKPKPAQVRLRLEYNGQAMELATDANPMVLGRGKRADMVVNDSMASREHARIECRRGKFILTDMSTNGTYVLTPDGPTYLRREDLVLSGDGQISLGRKFDEATEVVLYRLI